MNKLEIIKFSGSNPLFWGHQHGETYKDKIQEIAEIRMERMCNLSLYKKVKDVIELAKQHIIILQNFDNNLFLELQGISQSANISLEKLIVLNHYTDLRDINPADLNNSDEASMGCSLIYSPHKILGQTWDIHKSALDYVCLLQIDNSLVFSIFGCLGMMGVNAHKVAIGINNLSSTDAKIGIIWPALVRKVLQQKNAFDGKDVIMNSLLGSGHHYAIADENNFFAMETSGTKKSLITKNADNIYFHTNHCLCSNIAKNSYIRQGSNTLWRYDYLQQNINVDNAKTKEEVFLALKDVSITHEHTNSHATATCATISIDIKDASMIACQGISENKNLQDYICYL